MSRAYESEPMPVDPSELQWDGEDAFAFRGCHFTVDLGWAGNRRPSDDLSFTLVKNRFYIERYLDQLNFPASDIVEVGFFEGGSSVFLDRFYQPRRLVCLDRRVDPIEAVEAYRIRFGRTEHLRMVYGIDQGDQATLTALADEELPDGIDLVVDDASHQYELTKATLGVLLPRLRPGGKYVIEDWGWAHGAPYQDPDHPWSGNPALSNLIFELTMALASGAEAIRSVHLNRAMAIVTKGATPPSRAILDLSGVTRARGAKLSHI